MPRSARIPAIPSRRLPVLVAPILLSGLMIGLLLGLSGCGYTSTMGGPHGASSAEARGPVVRLAVLGLRNHSPEPWLDRILGDALRREMNLRSRLRLVADPEKADLILRGEIRPLNVRSNSFSSFVAALEYEVTLELDLEVVRASGDVLRLDPVGLSESELYLASPDIESTRTNRLEALRHLSDVLASRVADRLEAIERPITDGPPDSAPTMEQSPDVRGAEGASGG